jgi:hypothetical protein
VGKEPQVQKDSRDAVAAKILDPPILPHTRATIRTERYQLSIVTFKVDNLGILALYYYNDFHAISGMFKQIIEAPLATRDQLRI